MFSVFKSLYARLDALCKARPRTMAYGMLAFTTTALVVNPAVWKYPEFAAWVAVAVLGPLPFEIWARARRARRRSSSE